MVEVVERSRRPAVQDLCALRGFDKGISSDRILTKFFGRRLAEVLHFADPHAGCTSDVAAPRCNLSALEPTPTASRSLGPSEGVDEDDTEAKSRTSAMATYRTWRRPQ